MATEAPKQSLSGSFGRVKINGEYLCVSSYTVTATANWEETPTNCTPGYKTRSLVDRDWTADISFRYDGTNPPEFSEGDVIEDIELGNKVGTTETIEFSAPYGAVSSKRRNNPIPGTVSYDTTTLGQGEYQWGPLPTVTP